MAEIGDRIGPFELIECLSLGTRMTLFRGVRADGSDREPRQAIFRVTLDPGDTEMNDALRAEYEVLRAMQDDRLQRAWGLYAGHGALAIEFVHGVSLTHVLAAAAEGRIDFDLVTALDILVEVAYALRHAHAIVREEGRIVHGFLSAESVWLEPSGQVRVVGFASPDRPTGAAPEQFQGAVADPRTDQWLLGKLALALLEEVPEASLAEPVADDAEMFARLEQTQPALYRVLARMLAHEPEQRYEPEERMLKELLAVARQAGGVSRRVEIAARVYQISPAAVVERPSTLGAPAPRPPPAPVQEFTDFEGVKEPITEEKPFADEEPPPTEELPPWKRVRRNTMTGMPGVAPPPPPPPAPEPQRLTAPRPSVEVVPDWVAIATILLLVGAGVVALLVRFR